MILPILLILVLQVSVPTLGYPGGAPKPACSNMTPQHGGNPAQTTRAPFKLTTNATSVAGGQRIILTVEKDPEEFKGFFVQARTAQDDQAIGMFRTAVHKVLTCTTEMTGVTHSGSEKKPKITVEWEAPLDFEGDVAFRATILKSFTTYWVGVTSEKVTVQKRDAAGVEIQFADATDPAASDQTVATTTVEVTEKPPLKGLAQALNDLYNNCDTLKSCTGLPQGCAEKKNCKTLLTYTKANSNQYEFELKGQVTDNRYVAFGLSYDASMGDDSVVLCSVSGGEVDVSVTWNQGRSNVRVPDPNKGLTLLESGLFEGELYCRFRLDKLTKNNAKVFDLENEKYHILLAEGPMSLSASPQHHDQRIVSASPLNLGERTNLVVRDGRLFRLIHGCLMIGAWICTASIGMLFARYYKSTWVNYKCCSIDQWFHNHRFFMILTWSLTMAAFIIIILELQEFRPSKHAWIGLTSVVLCFIQPFMALLRPHPGTKRRPIFNIAHWFVGNAAQILGITAIFFGLELFFGYDRNWLKEAAWYILITFIAFHCVIHLVLSVAQCISDQRKAANDIFPLKELTDSRAPLNPQDKKRDAPLACFRKFILAVYIIVVCILTAALIIIVAIKGEHIEKQLKDWGSPEFWETEK